MEGRAGGREEPDPGHRRRPQGRPSVRDAGVRGASAGTLVGPALCRPARLAPAPRWRFHRPRPGWTGRHRFLPAPRRNSQLPDPWRAGFMPAGTAGTGTAVALPPPSAGMNPAPQVLPRASAEFTTSGPLWGRLMPASTAGTGTAVALPPPSAG